MQQNKINIFWPGAPGQICKSNWCQLISVTQRRIQIGKAAGKPAAFSRRVEFAKQNQLKNMVKTWLLELPPDPIFKYGLIRVKYGLDTGSIRVG